MNAARATPLSVTSTSARPKALSEGTSRLVSMDSFSESLSHSMASSWWWPTLICVLTAIAMVRGYRLARRTARQGVGPRGGKATRRPMTAREIGAVSLPLPIGVLLIFLPVALGHMGGGSTELGTAGRYAAGVLALLSAGPAAAITERSLRG